MYLIGAQFFCVPILLVCLELLTLLGQKVKHKKLTFVKV